MNSPNLTQKERPDPFVCFCYCGYTPRNKITNALELWCIDCYGWVSRRHIENGRLKNEIN